MKLLFFLFLLFLESTFCYCQIQLGFGITSTNTHQVSIENGNEFSTSAHLDGALFLGYEWPNGRSNAYIFQSGIQRYGEILGSRYALDYLRLGCQYSRLTGNNNPQLNLTVGANLNFADRTFSKIDNPQFRSTYGLFQKIGFRLSIGKYSSAELGITSAFDIGGFKHLQSADAIKFVSHGTYFQYIYAFKSLFKKNKEPKS